VEMVYLGVYSGTLAAARVLGLELSSQCSAYGHTRAAPPVEAKTVLNWAVRVWERGLRVNPMPVVAAGPARSSKSSVAIIAYIARARCRYHR